jgi:hypothetical protein
MTNLRKNTAFFVLIFVFFSGLIYCTSAAALDITVTILSPANGDTFQLGETIYFSGEGTIATSDSNLTGSDLVWMSSLDGKIGIGTYFTTSSLSAGHHRITLIGDNQAVASVEIDVTASSSSSSPPVTTGNYATYNMATNTLYFPYSPYPGKSYWINMSITSFQPFTLQLTAIGENAYDPNRAYATFNLLSGTLHVPDYRDTAGYSFWFDLQMDPSANPLQFELGGAGLN